LAIVKAIIAAHTTPAVRGERLRPRLIQGDGEALLVVANPGTQTETETIQLPTAYRFAEDVHSNHAVEVSDQTIAIQVEAQDVTVIALRTMETV
jgi:hypothetical protein